MLNLYNKLGELVLSLKTEQEKATLDIQSLPRGIYHLHVIDRNKIAHVEKIMIEH